VSRNQQREALERARRYREEEDSSEGGRQERRSPDQVRTMGGTRSIKVNDRGRAVETLTLGQEQADKINRKVERVGGSLTPGKGMAVARFVTVRDRPGFTMTGTHNGGNPALPGSKHQLAIYAPVGGGRRGGGTGGRQSPDTSSGLGARGGGQRQAYNRAQSFINSEAPGQATSPAPGQGVEAATGFADRLSAFTGDTIGAMHQRAQAGSYQQGRLLEAFAKDLPKAPDFLSGRDLIDLANQANRRIQVN
jgi:hypothetical protein